MATQRLAFLYPHLFPPARLQVGEAALRLQHPSRIRSKQCQQRAQISGTTKQQEQTIPKRYGTAQEPHLPASPSAPPTKSPEEQTLAETIEKEVKAPAAKLDDKQSDAASPAPPKEPRKPSFCELKKPTDPDSDTSSTREPAKATTPARPSPSQTMEQMAAALHKSRIGPDNTETYPNPMPLEKVFEMPAPTVEKPEEHRGPHLAPPPYVHHFDTFTLVKDLQIGGWTEEQSVTLMKAVRGLLGVNLDVAKEGLVGKSDVENETYLFRAACSELRTEILNMRKATSTTRNTQLHHLQHSADILAQRVSQETSSLKDDLRGMLNDRRMASREQSQQRDSEISELNYRISARLNSDSKSEVEGLRWTLTRRAAIGIAGLAVLILGSLRFGKMEMEAKRVEEAKRNQGMGNGGGGGRDYTVQSREMGTQTGNGDEMVVQKGEGVGYVSLG